MYFIMMFIIHSDVGLTNVSSRPDAKLTVIDDVCCGG